MTTFERLPRILKEPTGWFLIVLVAGFFYVQWPSKAAKVVEQEFYWQTLSTGLKIRWEAEPEQQASQNPEVWGLTRKGMSFLVQTDDLSGSFKQLVTSIAEQDQGAVAGAVQDPLVIRESFASYSFFDAESRIQRHHWYVVDRQWIKVSVLFKPSSEERVKRAEAFLKNISL